MASHALMLNGILGTDRVAEAARKLHPAPEIVVNLQGDQPFLDGEMILEAVQPLLDDPALTHFLLPP